ncbi:hypothetical protein RB25_25190 [Herbaspirillum rubrisubalbicans]|uniref:Uncharacterized protein n=1 Tax=Herbaspirillum rubrisubalbicans Os34 TaxID=1235827 RepID=A0A6M3ZY95_9BURK|nr:hypothetical protein [Herbaspirillum rubrisubalbicans]QJQ02492.1 hypothetical protein C798_20355 [Herbaspirillum rubrisubalbicans Os34]RAN42694.1 hypothetical protein RB25_25190 [Herbaspirillum rubrisubalbicans]
MKLPIYVAELIQERMASFLMGCDYPRAFYQHLPSEIDVDVRWTLSIEVLYRLLACSLIVPGHYRNEINSSKSKKLSKKMIFECRSYLFTLGQTDPESMDIEDYVAWQEWDLCIGVEGKKLLVKHGVIEPRSVLNNYFIKDVEDIFSQENVGWEVFPLIER